MKMYSPVLNSLNFILIISFNNFQTHLSKSSIQATNLSSQATQGNCEYKMPDGKYFNLLPLRQGDDYTFKFKKYIYKVNFCGPLVTNMCTPDMNVPAAIYINSK